MRSKVHTCACLPGKERSCADLFCVYTSYTRCWKKMSKEITWVKVDSKSHPGRCYYYNRVSKASTWERPPELQDVEIPSHPAVVKGGKKVRSPSGMFVRLFIQRGSVSQSAAVSDSTKNRPVEDAWSQPENSSHQKKTSADVSTVTEVGLKSTHSKVVCTALCLD